MAIQAYKPYSIYHTERPGIFLAGPIQGAPDWQQVAMDKIAVASDRRRVDLAVFDPRVEKFFPENKTKQIQWEKTYLERARNHGAILFWFAAQDLTIDDYPEGRAYAQTSRIEFGRVMGWMDYNSRVRTVIGIDPEYEGGNYEYIKNCADEYSIPIHQDLGQLCMHAVDVVRLDAHN
jgi:hypothetical protein